MRIVILFLVIWIFSSCRSVLFYPTGITSPEGTAYIYQPVNKKGIPVRLPDLFYCKDCELELRGKKVYLKGTKEEIK